MLKLERHRIAAMLLCLATTGVGYAADNTTVNEVYDVADLTFGQNAAASLPEQKSGTFAPQLAEQSTTGDDALIHLIEGSILPESWKDNGGTVGAMHMYGTQLIVSQTQEAQNQIKQLLNDVRASRASIPMVSLRAYWLTLTPDEVAQIYRQTHPKEGSASGPIALPIVPDNWLTPPRLYAVAQGIGFNSRTATLSAARESEYIKNVVPIVGTNAVGYQTDTDIARSGTSLRITPQLNRERTACLIDLHGAVEEKTVSATTRPAEMGSEPAPTPGKPQGVVQQINSTVSIPLGKCVLLGGTTVDSSPTEGSTRTIFLAVCVDALQE